MMNEPLVEEGALQFSDEKTEIFAAFVAAQAEIENVSTDGRAEVKTKGGGKFSYSYASIAAIQSVMRPTLHKHGLATMQGTNTRQRGVVAVETYLIHSSGQWAKNTLTLHINPQSDPQEVGSAVSYARRYGLTALLNIASADDDDDGASATRASRERRSEPQAEQADPFEDPNRDPSLVSKEVYTTILEVAQGLTPTEKKALTAWREAAGIQIRVNTLTAEDGQRVLDQLAVMLADQNAPEAASMGGDDNAGELVPDSTDDPDPLGLNNITEDYS